MLSAVERGDEILCDAEILVEHPAPDAPDDRHRQDVGQEEGGEHQALHPALEAIHAERDDQREKGARQRR